MIMIWIKMKTMTIIEVVAMPPLEESNMSCQPPDLPHRSMSWHGSVGNENDDFAYDDTPSRPLCEDPGFTGDLLETPRKIVVLMPFGFEVKLTID